ncbi:esterase [Rhodococcus sp. WB1]|uniref:flavin-containing monooxygenase n=1 Tax=Rhodococcus TaxID=1827 RepID=UPI00045D44D4|nr:MULTISPECIES: alpha/beta hydrolase fold domain-containing protein [Rhodococcus]ANZ26880.1 esterase [Rhodococcus sp. WB1]KDE14614.1 esterase [Rhodococcus aetherivorans]
MKADKDVVIVGAGFAGLYAVHKLRNELGLEVQAFDAGGGPGGTWWWNRYPGARCDFDSVYYSYSFSEEIQREWQWTEKYAAQPEILNYLEWVADRLDLKRSFQFNTRVTSMVWNDEGQYWTVGTDDGRTCTARYVVCGTGNVSIPKKPEFPGIEDFKGEVLQTSSWPHEPVDFSGKRVGIIGTGATGIQLIPELAKHAAHLTVFQRTAQFASPLGNEKLDPEARRWLAENHKQVRAGARDHFLGAPYDAPRPSALADSPEERKKVYDEHYGSGGFRMVVSTYGDLLYNRESNDTIADYLRDRIRERVTDPKIAEMLCPTDHPYATKRAPFETNYYETYNRDNVTLVDVRSTPIERVTEHALKTTAAEYEIDVLVMATGFDVFTRPLLEMGIVGRDGLTLDEKWSGVPGTYLGIQTAGFPNLFTVTGPQSAVALYNNALAIEDHVEWISRAIGHLRTTGATTIEPTAEAESRWGDFAEGILNQTLIPQSESSWYMGANVVGKTRGTYIFAAGAPVYRAICAQVAERGYAGFAIDGVETAVPPMAKLDPEVVTALSAIHRPGYKPLEDCTVEETRAMVEQLVGMQVPGPDMQVDDIVDPAVRLYVPRTQTEGTRPVIVFLHGGGWVAGSLDVVDNPCRQIARATDAIVVSVDYRLAPEHPFPAAHDDAFEAVRWVQENIAGYGGDADKIVIMGESAGGNLAASTALRARDAGLKLAGQVLVYPPTDPEASTQSRVEFADGPFLSVKAVDTMWGAYLNGAEVTETVAPLRAENLRDLPPALIFSMELDPTRDEAEDYARALQDAGVRVELHRFEGMIHGVFNMDAIVSAAPEMYSLTAQFVADTVTAEPVSVR